jgi:glycosyltransferase involved in cell wall biosynthesis
MRIGVNCYNLVPQNGGITQYFHTLFQELLSSDDRNEYVFFWFEQNAEELARLARDRWRARAVRLERQGDIRAHFPAIDLYFCPLNALHPRPAPVPAVVAIADIQDAFHPENFTADVLHARDRHLVGSSHMADCVITHSHFTRQTLVDEHRLSPGKIVVVHHCPGRIFSAPAAARPAGLPAGLPGEFILYPANFWKHKNHERLLEALRVLREQRGLAVDLVLTGLPVPNGNPVELLAGRLGVAAQVHPLGHVAAEDLRWLYGRARMLVFPSCFEGFGIPLLEAMVCGCPVAAADATAIPEVVGEAALLFDPGSPTAIAEAIARLWSDADLRRELAARGRRRAESFSRRRMMELHLAAFEQAVGAFSRGRYVWRAWGYRPYQEARAAVRRAGRFLAAQSVARAAMRRARSSPRRDKARQDHARDPEGGTDSRSE